MSQVPQQGFVPEKIQEFNRRASQDMSDSPSHQKVQRNPQDTTPKKEPNQNGTDKPTDEKSKQDLKPKSDTSSPARPSIESKNPFSSNFYRNRQHGHFEMGPRGLDYSPHRMGMEFTNRLRDYGPQRSTSIHGHELTDGPVKPEYLGHRAHFGSQIVPGGINHPDVVFRHDYYNQMGFSPPRASRFSSQEYLNAPAQYGRWPDYRSEYRQRRRSQQDLHSMEHSPESGNTLLLVSFINNKLIMKAGLFYINA
ncbi:unnamed protein product [Parnassius mnemosyne]|uniref:Uncharacterized protein n=1 Tax=Parnassius mnemosyne TaxID=213953 RepID=A0AAV1LJJ9_9NEOP